MQRILFLCLLVWCLGGCTIGPDYRQPEVDTPDSWRLSEQDGRELAGTAWWELFADPVLTELIAAALRENQDLRIAAARVEQYAGRYGATRADLFPQVGASGEAGRQRTSEAGDNPVSPGYKSTTDSFAVSVSAGWEIDLWGRIRRLTEAARAELLASEEGRRGVVLTLVGDVAAGYVTLRALDRQLEITRQTARTREESYKLFQERFAGGLISDLELSQNRSQYEEALAAIPALEKAVAQQENGLCVLLGRNPGLIPRGRSIDELEVAAPAAGMPSTLLARRPDIRRAEQNLIAANARIGAARAAYFPTIGLTGAFGSASGDLDDLFTGPAKIWQYSVPVSLPIFTAGRIAGNVREAEAMQAEMLASYRQAVQNGFREVNDALVARVQTGKQLAAQQSQVNSLRQYADIARLRYDNGYTDYLAVLDAERSLFNVELSATQTRADLHLALIGLYKALGGGWVARAEELAQPVRGQ